MNWLIENWFIVVAGIAILAFLIVGIYTFLGLPTKKQIEQVKEWLKYAVTLAEKELGEKTGQLKLRMVYDLFLGKFPKLSGFISFELFSSWVDDALEWLEKQLANNKAIVKMVEGES